jgi:ABC-type transport system substrate-binding protein
LLTQPWVFFWAALLFATWPCLHGCRSQEKPSDEIRTGGALYFGVESPFHGFDVLGSSGFINPPQAVEAGTHDRKPVGTGPFRYAKWNSGDHFVVLRNERYWQAGKPVLNKVVFRAMPDHQTRYASLLAGELDFIALDRGNLISKAQRDEALFTFNEDDTVVGRRSGGYNL